MNAPLMIDTHCHILPGLDDGAPDLVTALAMARGAVADGVRTVIATPHWWPRSGSPSTEEIAERVVALRAALAGAGLDLRLEVGAEVALAPDVLEAADEGALPCLAGTRHVLVEAYPTGDLDLARRLIFELQLRGYRVVLAHPERLSALIDRPERARELSAGGVLLQVTRAGLTGRLSWRMGRLARWLIQEGLADLLATDAHGPGDQVRLTSVRKLCGRLAGPAAFECLTVTNPARLLEAAP